MEVGGCRAWGGLLTSEGPVRDTAALQDGSLSLGRLLHTAGGCASQQTEPALMNTVLRPMGQVQLGTLGPRVSDAPGGDPVGSPVKEPRALQRSVQENAVSFRKFQNS